MKLKSRLLRRIIAAVLTVAVVLAALPMGLMTFAAPTDSYYDRVVDQNTMDNWKNYFSLTDITTENAGGVWTDKSVFADNSAFGGLINMKDGDKNFLTALSAIAANKEVVGYSTVPTDTVLVLDASGSMNGSYSALVTAANNAITELLSVNENNRVGVVLYSASGQAGTSTYNQSVTRLLPIARYTTASDNRYIYLQGSTVKVDSDTRAEGSNSQINTSKSFGGGTYIQAGLWEAMKMFNEMDTVIGENNWQSGDNRMPILVLMSDGAPSTGTTNYADVDVSRSNVGNGNESNLRAGNAFLTQLTASYVMNRIEAHYQTKDPNVRGLFYTLGFNIGNNDAAQAVMNPDSSSYTDNLWAQYSQLTNGNMVFSVKNTSGNAGSVSINKNSYVTNKSYVDEYFSASGNGLTDAFQSIVDEIILQSRYYPTHLEGGSPDFSGYVEFTDIIGEYMEIKDIKGILLGDTLFDGHMMASKIADTSSGGLGTVENPTALGDEFIRAVKTRLGISDTADAQNLVAQAFAAGQLRYNSPTDWSNYIGWYAKSDGTFAGFYNEGTTTAPADAVYINKSYGFLGETHGSIKNSDMMYMSVQIHTNISTGQQTLILKIPAALVPLVTYAVTLEGTNVDEAKNVQVTIENADSVAPIRLVYESGLRSDLNELNITRITDQKHIAADGVTRRFWTNYFDISADQHEDHVTALSEFTPSKENERFYYTFDSAVLKKNGNSYILVGENEGTNGALDTSKEYYHRRYIFTDDSSTPIFTYEKMSKSSIAAAKWDGQYETLDKNAGAWVVPKGTPARELSMYSADKDNNITDSAHMIFYPYLTEQNNTFYVDMNLGNNGRLSVTPAQGIKISKTIDIYEEGTSDEFRFRITAREANGTPLRGNYDIYISNVGETPLGQPQTATFLNGVYEFDLSAGKTLWITGISSGVSYVVEEISDNVDYKLKSVHVNGTATGATAVGTVAAYLIDDVAFVNTAVGEGDLIITKQVVDQNGRVVEISDQVEFTAEVTLTTAAGAPLSGSFESSKGTLTLPANGKFTITLKAGESFIVRGLTEGTRYTVEETNIPEGFTLNAAESNLTGEVDALASDQALIVNTYRPVATNGDGIEVTVNKVISGNRTNWMAGESYTFVLEQNGNVIATKSITADDTNKTALFALSSEDYTEAGTYNYRIYEQKGNQGGITYDSTDRRFSVTVADSDMDGHLEVTAVTNLSGTTVSGSYNVSATFTNVYAPTGSATVTLNIVKSMNGNYRLDGFRFALYDADPRNSSEANEIVRSTATNSAGNANITLVYTADSAKVAGTEYNYWLAEIDTGNPNISYDTRVYPVTVTVYDNGDGTISANLQIDGLAQGQNHPTFENAYIPSSSDFITISGTKEIDGDRALNSGEFSFNITPDTAGAPLPSATTVRNGADGSFSFGAIEFTDAYKGQDFVYTVSEDHTNKIGGFTYDDATYKVYVSVVDNGDATLTAEVTKIEKVKDAVTTVSDIKFVNAYDAQDAEVILSGTKLLTGKTLQNGEFTFKLEALTENAPMPASSTTANDQNGNFAFGKIVYSKAGIYRYSLAEVSNGDTRYDFDKSVYTVAVTVTDNSNGRLSATVRLIKDGLDSSEIVFRNGFVPAPVSFDIYDNFGGEKILEGRPIKAGEFEFALINAISGAQIGQTVKNDENGEFSFPAVTIPSTGIYHFKITETVGDEIGVSYDNSSYHIRIEVIQKTDGTLEIADKQLYRGTVNKQEVGGDLTEVTEYTNITANGSVRFVNTYKGRAVSVAIEATKNLTGREILDGEFGFDLYAADSEFTKGELLQDDVLNEGKKVVFEDITFGEAGDYFFVILEDETDGEGVTNDKQEYKVFVDVTDNLNGLLVADLYVNGTLITEFIGDSIVFNNSYKADAAEIKIIGNKMYANGTLKDDMFSFQLYDKDGMLIETVTNKGSDITFSTITAETAGQYVYTVKEVKGDDRDVIYDKTVYTVTATVTDNLDGTMTVSYVYATNKGNSETLTFLNTYAPTPVEIPVTGDYNNGIGLWIALLFVSGGLFGGTTLYTMRKRAK